jgi:hypothetical protein
VGRQIAIVIALLAAAVVLVAAIAWSTAARGAVISPQAYGEAPAGSGAQWLN